MSRKWLIKLDRVTISYKVDRHSRAYAEGKIFTPLCNVSLEVHEGEFLSISGPNGSGKTSLLKVMSGVMQPFEGTVAWQVINFGFVSQYQVLLPELTIRENILLPFYIHGERKGVDAPPQGGDDAAEVNKKLDLYVKRFKIEEILDKHPYTCSIGQQQRALLARALTMDRNIIFADEPEQNLDSDGRMELFQSFKEANSGFGKTIVLVSQEHPDVLKQFASRGIKIKDNSIIEIFRDGRTTG